MGPSSMYEDDDEDSAREVVVVEVGAAGSSRPKQSPNKREFRSMADKKVR